MVRPSRTLALDPTARTVFEALERLGWKADPHALAQKIEDLAQGLPAEDEFAALVAGLQLQAVGTAGFEPATS